MDGSLDDLKWRAPLLGADGQWDRVGLAAWFQDDACWKAAMPDNDLSYVGPRAGDLLITDESVAPYVGGLVLVTDEDMTPVAVGLVDRDAAGRLCVEDGHDLLPIEGEGLAHGLVLVVVGFVPLPAGGAPTLQDLLRAEALPRQMLPQALSMPPEELPF